MRRVLLVALSSLALRRLVARRAGRGLWRSPGGDRLRHRARTRIETTFRRAYGWLGRFSRSTLAHKLSLKRAAGALQEADIPFLLGGGAACWVRGGPELGHDVDFMLKPEDAERAVRVLVRRGMRRVKPPEDFVFVVWDGDVRIDLNIEPKGLPITDEVLARGEELDVLGIRMRVMRLEDVFATKLLALREYELDYRTLLRRARALREQVDWDEVEARTNRSPYAKAFFTLIRELGIADSSRPAVEKR